MSSNTEVVADDELLARASSGGRSWAGQPRAVRVAQHAGFILILGTLWELAVRMGLVAEFVLGRPSEVAVEFLGLVGSASTWGHVRITLSELALGLFFGIVLGCLSGVALNASRQLRLAIEPLILGFYTVPKLALVPLFIAWFGFGMIPQVLVAGIHAFVIFVLATQMALDTADDRLVSSVRLMGGRKRDVMRYVYLPFSMAYLLPAFRQAVALGIASVIVAEMIGPRGGIGFLLTFEMSRFDAAGVIALIVLAALLAVVLDVVAGQVEKWSLSWRI